MAFSLMAFVTLRMLGDDEFPEFNRNPIMGWVGGSLVIWAVFEIIIHIINTNFNL